MKKRLIVAPLALALAGGAWAGTTLYTGAETRDAYERLVAQLDAASGLSVRTASLEEGFMTSLAITEVRPSDDPDAPVLARLRHEIAHSPGGLAGGVPSAARIVTTFAFDDAAGASADAEVDAVVRALLDGFGGAAPLTLVSTVGFGGAIDNRVSLAAWRADVDGGSISVEPGTWDVAVGADGSFEGTGRWGGARVDAADGTRLSVGAAEDRFAYAKRGPRLYDGEYRVDFAPSELRHGATGMGGTVGAASIVSSSSIGAGRAGFETAVALEDMALPLPLESVRYEIGARGLDLSGLERAIASGDGVSAAAFADDGDGTAVEAAFADYLDALAGLVVPGAEATFALHLGNAGGDADARATVLFEGDGSGAGLASLVTVGDLARATRTTLALDVDEAAVAITPAAMFLDPAALAPWVVSDGTRYTADIVLDDLIVDVNGVPMSLEDMAGEALAAPLGGPDAG